MNDPRKSQTTVTRAVAVLRDVARRGGDATWSDLHRRGHSFSTVWACVKRGWLMAPSRYSYEITPEGHSEIVQHG